MNNFEKKYYDDASFWDDGMLEDENNRQRIIITADLIPNDVKTLADIGCGNGVFLNYLKTNNTNLDLTGIDRSETALKFVKTKKQQGDIVSLPFSDEHFDCVSCLEVIEHLPVPIYETALKELCRISKKYVIISVPYAEKIEDSYTKCPKCLSIFNYELHLRKYEKTDIEILLNSNNYKCISYQTLGDTEKYIGHNLFRKIFYPEQLLKWNSPICSICGFETEMEHNKPHSKHLNHNTKRSITSYLTAFPKLFWPKIKKHYWILALYEKQ